MATAHDQTPTDRLFIMLRASFKALSWPVLGVFIPLVVIPDFRAAIVASLLVLSFAFGLKLELDGENIHQ